MNQLQEVREIPAIQAPEPEQVKLNRNQLLRENEIFIRFLSRGCIIRVGCKEIAFEDTDNAMNELMEYAKDPYKTSEKWHKILNQG
jgi:hypothetical protein